MRTQQLFSFKLHYFFQNSIKQKDLCFLLLNDKIDIKES